MSIPAELQKELHEAYFLFDYDNDKKITSKELGAVVRSVGLNPTEGELKEMIKEVDAQFGGKIDAVSLGKLLANKVKGLSTTKEELQDAFQVFDKNGNGMIQIGDMKHSLTTLGERLTDEELDELIREVDQDGEGQFNYEDMVKILLAK